MSDHPLTPSSSNITPVSSDPRGRLWLDGSGRPETPGGPPPPVSAALRRTRLLGLLVITFGAAVAIGAPNGVASIADPAPRFVCLPTCAESDGRMFAIAAGRGADTVTGSSLTLEVGAPAMTRAIEIGIFDGDTGGWWDQGREPLRFQVTADPKGDGSGSLVVLNVPGTRLLDNGWHSITVPAVPEARSAGGHYFYTLHISLPEAAVTTVSAFKVRTDAAMTLRPQPFSFIASVGSSAEAAVIYPAYPKLQPTRYDGTWSFVVRQPVAPDMFEVWDGDFDFGSSACADRDTHDEDTPAGGPAWDDARLALAEGVAVGLAAPCGILTGDPADDDGANDLYRRSPSVRYSIVMPDGTRVDNLNASGNREWERFAVSSNPALKADRRVTALEPGLYRIEIAGLDLGNLVALRLAESVLAVDAAGHPIPMPPLHDQRASRRGLLDELTQRRAEQAGTDVAPALGAALQPLERSLARDLWSDDDRPQRDKVFFESRDALRQLADLARARTTTPWLSGYVDRLTDLDRRIAEQSLVEARVRRVETAVLERASAEYLAGTTLRATDPLAAHDVFVGVWRSTGKY